MFDVNKFSWLTRIKICWEVLIKGTYGKIRRTRHEQRQWDLCRNRDEEMNKCVRPRSDWVKDHKLGGPRRIYTDYDERKDFEKGTKGSGLYCI